MRLPFVTRAHYDAVVAMQSQTIEHQRVQYASLEARYHMLRLQGYAPPSAVPDVVPSAPPSPVDAAIGQMSKGNHRLADAMRAAAAQDRLTGLSETDIAQRIYSGTPTADRVAL